MKSLPQTSFDFIPTPANQNRRKYPIGSDTRSRLHRIWNCMIARCYHPANDNFKYYGARGIGVCEEWRNGYEPFRSWALDNGYRAGLSIDRKDNEQGYSPDNCRWQTHTQQLNNRRYNVKLTAWGETKTLPEWSRDCRCVVSMICLRTRVAVGMDAEQSMTKPARMDTLTLIEAWGEAKPIQHWITDPRCKVGRTGLRKRLKSGMPPEEAMSSENPSNGRYVSRNTLTAWGETKTLIEWSQDARCVVKLETLRARNRHWASGEKILTAPLYPR